MSFMRAWRRICSGGALRAGFRIQDSAGEYSCQLPVTSNRLNSVSLRDGLRCAPVPEGPVSGGSDLSRRTRPRYSTAGNHPIIRNLPPAGKAGDRSVDSILSQREPAPVEALRDGLRWRRERRETKGTGTVVSAVRQLYLSPLSHYHIYIRKSRGNIAGFLFYLGGVNWFKTAGSRQLAAASARCRASPGDLRGVRYA